MRRCIRVGVIVFAHLLVVGLCVVYVSCCAALLVVFDGIILLAWTVASPFTIRSADYAECISDVRIRNAIAFALCTCVCHCESHCAQNGGPFMAVLVCTKTLVLLYGSCSVVDVELHCIELMVMAGVQACT